jgi:hypothetical protein
LRGYRRRLLLTLLNLFLAKFQPGQPRLSTSHATLGLAGSRIIAGIKRGHIVRLRHVGFGLSRSYSIADNGFFLLLVCFLVSLNFAGMSLCLPKRILALLRHAATVFALQFLRLFKVGDLLLEGV